jgi:translation elongation factor EF-Ts
MVKKYKDSEGKKPVKIKDKTKKELIDKWYKVIERDMLHEQDFVRHSSKKIASIIDDLVDGWVK